MMRMQALFGVIPQIKTKGHYAKVVMDMMLRMRREQGAESKIIAPQIDSLIILDRDVDLVTPMRTQLTCVNQSACCRAHARRPGRALSAALAALTAAGDQVTHTQDTQHTHSTQHRHTQRSCMTHGVLLA